MTVVSKSHGFWVAPPGLPVDVINSGTYEEFDQYMVNCAEGEPGLVLLLGRPGGLVLVSSLGYSSCFLAPSQARMA